MTNPAEDIELLPCPFCGSSDIGTRKVGGGWNVDFFVECQSCNAGIIKADEAGAIKQWNTRASLTPTETEHGE